MGFLDNLSKTLSSGTERVKFEADKFQRTSRISGEVANLKTQIDTNLRQLGERTLELYQQGTISAPEVASLAQIITQLREQQTAHEHELNEAQNAQFESDQPQATAATAQQVPIMSAPVDTMSTTSSTSATHTVPNITTPPVADVQPTMEAMSGTPTHANASASSSVQAVGSTPYACPTCGYSLPQGAMFCPNCGGRTTT